VSENKTSLGVQGDNERESLTGWLKEIDREDCVSHNDLSLEELNIKTRVGYCLSAGEESTLAVTTGTLIEDRAFDQSLLVREFS
jgi:hypothetical protein